MRKRASSCRNLHSSLFALWQENKEKNWLDSFNFGCELSTSYVRRGEASYQRDVSYCMKKRGPKRREIGEIERERER